MSPTHDKRLRHLENFHQVASWISRLAWRNGGKDSLSYTPPVVISLNSDPQSHREEAIDQGLAKARSTTQKPAKSSYQSLPTDGGATSPYTPSQTPHKRPGLSTMTSEFQNHWGESVMISTRNDISLRNATAKGGSGGCKIIIWRKEDGWCGRGNTVAGWVEMNRAVSRIWDDCAEMPLTWW